MSDIFVFQVQGKNVTIDADQKELAESYRWYLNHKGYVICPGVNAATLGHKKMTVSLHRILMGAEKGQVVDHKNHDIYDNRRSNLRICTYSQNTANMRPPRDGKYKGVHQRSQNSWRAVIRVRGKLIALGHFNSPEKAALAYNEAAKLHFGEFAFLNDIKEK